MEIDKKDIPAIVRALLETPFWLETVPTMKQIRRQHDDNGGTNKGVLGVMFTPHGDAGIWIDEINTAIRFRYPGGGGGVSPRTRAALVILAEAMRLDNEEHPRTGE